MSFQQVIIIGNLGRDPEMKYTPSGVPVTKFSVAVSRSWTGQDGQKQEKTVWFNVSAWTKLAEFASQYLTKGQSVVVVGEIDEVRVWQDQSGNHRPSLEVRAQTIRFNGPRPDSSGSSSGGDYYEGGGGGGDDYSGGGQRNGGSTGRAQGGSAGRGSEHSDPDDIPF
jgi:single-strand DNA-binding protein